MLRLLAGRTDKTKLNDEMQVLSITTLMLKNGEKNRKRSLEELRRNEFYPYLPEMYMLADQKYENKPIL